MAGAPSDAVVLFDGKDFSEVGRRQGRRRRGSGP
jgi:hypothetical protein